MEHPVVEFSRLWNAFCATGEGGGVDPSCSPGEGSGGGAPPSGPKRERINYKGTHVTIEHTGPGKSKIVEGPPDLVGKALKVKERAPTPPPPAEPPEPRQEAPEPKREAPAAPSFSSPEGAEDHFAATYRTNLSRGKGMSDAEYVKTAKALASEHDRMASEFEAVQKTLDKRTSRGQTLMLGEDFSSETGSARGASSSYKFGEGIRLGQVPLGEHRPPVFGQHAVDGGTDLRTQFRHEFAHEVFGETFSGAKRSEWMKVAKPFVGTATVSRYGGTNESELFSESFAAYTSPRYSRGSLPPAIEKFLDKNVKGKRTDNQATDDDWIPFEPAWNAFCAAGEGGGVDPSCSPGKGDGDLVGDDLKAVQKMAKDVTDSLRDFGYDPSTPLDHPLAMTYTRIRQYQQGTLLHKESLLEEDARKFAEIREHFKPVRQKIRELVGDHILLYRGADVEGGVPGKFLSSYTPDRKVAERFLEGYNSRGERVPKVLKTVSVPVDAIHMVFKTEDRPLEFMIENDKLPKHLSSNSLPQKPTGNALDLFSEAWVSANVFCATGKGGGVDPSCSPEGGGKSLAERLSPTEFPYDAFPLPKTLYRGTEARTHGAEFRESHEGGELGVGIYATPHEWLASTYGGGPRASVKAGTRVVHQLEFTRPIYPEEVAYLSGGLGEGEEAVLVSGSGIELWRGLWQAKTSQRSNVTEMNRTARDSGVKVIVGLDDSVAKNQIAVLDKSLLRKR